MAWVKIDDQFFVNRKARAVGLEGRALFMASVCYCGMQLNDGRFPESDVPVIAAFAGVPQDIGATLIKHGLWDVPEPGIIEVHDYLVYNPTREQVIARKHRAEKAAAARHATSSATSTATSKADGLPIPSPSPSPSPRPSSSSSSVNAIGDDVWRAIADRKAAAQPTPPRNPAAWKAKVIENDMLELGERAASLMADYQLTSSQLADILLSDTNPSWLIGLRRGALGSREMSR